MGVDTFINCWQECKLGKATTKIKELKLNLLYNPAISLFGIHAKESKSTYYTETYTPIFIEVFITYITLDQSRYQATGEQIKRWDACTLCS